MVSRRDVLENCETTSRLALRVPKCGKALDASADPPVRSSCCQDRRSHKLLARRAGRTVLGRCRLPPTRRWDCVGVLWMLMRSVALVCTKANGCATVEYSRDGEAKTRVLGKLPVSALQHPTFSGARWVTQRVSRSSSLTEHRPRREGHSLWLHHCHSFWYPFFPCSEATFWPTYRGEAAVSRP